MFDKIVDSRKKNLRANAQVLPPRFTNVDLASSKKEKEETRDMNHDTVADGGISNTNAAGASSLDLKGYLNGNEGTILARLNLSASAQLMVLL